MLACFENKQTTCTTETNSHIKISFLKKCLLATKEVVSVKNFERQHNVNSSHDLGSFSMISVSILE
jgi:hypothetical protein